jgi:hypothetical protein
MRMLSIEIPVGAITQRTQTFEPSRLPIKVVGRLKRYQGRPVLLLRFAVPSERYDSLVSESLKRFSSQGLGPSKSTDARKRYRTKKLFHSKWPLFDDWMMANAAWPVVGLCFQLLEFRPS